MKSYLIEIHAATQDDAELALAEVCKAIAEGYMAAPWNPAGDNSECNGYQFSSSGEFDE